MIDMTTGNAPTITETRFQKLRAKLRELFELDKSDLDFGIYRIMAAKNEEVTNFLDRQLRDAVKTTLHEHGAGATKAVQTELDETIANLRAAGLDEDQIEGAKKVKELRAKLQAAGGKTGEELEADIYNHLLTFFGRYYEEGDFISKRRYKGDTYAIPYSGEEVTLHWANKDQYYIKSGEWHKDYRFRLADGRRVRFALVDATQEAGNNKESDEAKRRYILVDDDPVVAEGRTLTLRFHFKTPSEAEKERAADGAVAVFGGEYAKERAPKKGDERTQFCADAEQRVIEHIPAEWKDAVTAAAATNDKPLRTLLGKHLDAFTARNTFDYFIHKDLGGFLRRELDFYIKNEVVRLDDLDTAPAEHLQRVQGRVRAIRRVASKVIELLESLENFQKKLWLKKKCVLNTSWLVTVDRVPERLRETVAENAEQWAEWERLGFKPEGDDAGGLFGGAEWGTRAYLDACDKLVVDTRLYDEAFTANLLESEKVLGGASTLYSAVSGELVHGENHGAGRLLLPTYRGAIDCLYSDPPYNTGGDGFIYRDGFPHASWMTLLDQFLALGVQLIHGGGAAFFSIDENELERLLMLLPSHLLWAGNIVVQNNPKGRYMDRHLSTSHEYLVCSVRESGAVLSGIPKPEEKLSDDFPHQGEHGRYRLLELRNTHREFGRHNRPNLFYPLYCNVGTGSVSLEPFSDSVEVYPIWNDGFEGCWTWGRDKAAQQMDQLECREVGGSTKVYRRAYAHDSAFEKPKTIWAERQVQTEVGQATLNALFGDNVFRAPKPTRLVEKCIHLSGSRQLLIADFFAGSGTTGHAVLGMNRDGRHRRVLLAEMGEQFSQVLVPRVSRVIYSPDWRGGKAVRHDQGLSALVKCFAVESYEDALNNLPAPTGDMFDGRPAEETDALIRYALDLEMGPQLLDLDIFRDPWGHAINAQLAGDDEIKRHRVDLVETFNYLIGLRVGAYGPIARYKAEFERAEHDEDEGQPDAARSMGRLRVKGALRRDADGPFKFQHVEGVINPAVRGGNEVRVLVLWRTLTDDPEEDAAVLDEWMRKQGFVTTEKTPYADYHEIYVNGPVTLPQPTEGIRKVLPIEEAFKRKMFEDTDEGL